jgi:mRNA-degrading endonuclease RelE of RelBE toxin-antitoxin system
LERRVEPWASKAVPRYNKRRKKLPREVRRVLNEQQARILQDPYRGERKRGPLKDIWVEKFQAQNDQCLLAYEIVEKDRLVIFYDVGQHEGFYRELERYKKSAK